MNFNFGQRGERLEIHLLAARRPRIGFARHPRGEVAQPVDRVPARNQKRGQAHGIEPLERRTLQGSVEEIEAVDIDPRSHHRPRTKQGPLRGTALEPTARCRRVSACNLSPNRPHFKRHCTTVQAHVRHFSARVPFRRQASCRLALLTFTWSPDVCAGIPSRCESISLPATPRSISPIPSSAAMRSPVPGAFLRPVPVTFGRFRYRSGFIARRSAEDLPSFRRLEALHTRNRDRNAGVGGRVCCATAAARGRRPRPRRITQTP